MELECLISKTIFRREDTGFSIVVADRIVAGRTAGAVIIKGVLASDAKNLHLICDGEWINDRKYGKQFVFSSYHEILPATAAGIESYLSSGMIKGIGPKIARRIVRKFGSRSLDIIAKEPERLLEVQGIGKDKLAKITKSWAEQKAIADIMVFFKGHDISTGTAMKILRTYGEDCIRKIKEHPYRLCQDIRGIGFRTADAIAMNLGVPEDSPERIEAGIFQALQDAVLSGHCYLTRNTLATDAAGLLKVDRSITVPGIESMIERHVLIQDKDDSVYLRSLHRAEASVAEMLKALLDSSEQKINRKKAMERVQEHATINYDPKQLEAIEAAITSKVLCITGGPGVGKSTVIKGVIEAFKSNYSDILLAAPTGRAAKRLAEATGMEAKTIHRLLEYNREGGFNRNADEPLEGDVLIVDECSMIDIFLMDSLLDAVPLSMTVILVGDVDQLPSVGPGNVLNDIIASGAVPVARLTSIFRQAQGSKIILNSHRINEGQDIDLNGGKDSDFFFIREDEDESISDTIVALCKERLPKHYGYDRVKDIQVLTPMKKSTIGVQAMNEKLQNALNPDGEALKYGGGEFRVGDKVMQIVNDYDKDVFNGDIGYVIAVDTEDKTLSIKYDDKKIVEYESEDFPEIQLAYACTIHKSQGSEYPVVVMPVSMAHYIMLQRNLLYTGVTRARKLMILVGDKSAVTRAIRNNQIAKRNTMLADRLRPEEAAQSGEIILDAEIV